MITVTPERARALYQLAASHLHRRVQITRTPAGDDILRVRIQLDKGVRFKTIDKDGSIHDDTPHTYIER